MYALVAIALAWLGIGRAHAECFPSGTDHFECETIGEAYAKAQSFAAPDPDCETGETEIRSTEINNKFSKFGYHDGRCGAAFWHGWGSAAYATGCAAGSEWDEVTHGCWTPPDDGECLARNAQPGFKMVGPVVKSFSSKCIAGCTYQAVGPSVTMQDSTRSVFEWTGTCSTPPSPPEPNTPDEAADHDDQKCEVVSAGMSRCLNRDGDVCYTATATQQLCWGVGETGEKTEGPVMQKRDPGDTATPPNLNLPNGDTLTPKGDPVTTTTTQTDGAGNVTTITTTVTNYNTTSGADAGDENQGQPGDGSDDGDQDGTTTGGGDCGTAPTVSDPALDMIADQAWHTRCAVEAANKGGTGTIGDCDVAYTVEGDSANADQLRAMRAQLCPDLSGLDPSDYLGDGTGEPDGTGRVFGDDLTLDTAGFGYGDTCPTIPPVAINGHTLNFDTSVFCDWMHLGGWFVLLLASMTSVLIIVRA